MHAIYLLLLVLGAVLFGLAALAPLEPVRLRLVAGGLLAWELVELIRTARAG